MNDIHDLIEEDKDYELVIGKSFQNGSKASYHLLKYDFKPAAIDKTQDARVEIGVKNDVVIEVPHVEGSTEKYTQFTGNKQPGSAKDCVLIFNTETKTFTLERLESNFSLKRNRLVSSSKPMNQLPSRSITPTFDKSNVKKPKTETVNTAAGNLESSVKKDADATSKPRSSLSTSSADKSFKPMQMIKEPSQSNLMKPIKKDETPSSSSIEASKPISFIDDLNLSGSDTDGSEL